MDRKYIDILEEHIQDLGKNQDLLSTIGILNQKLKKEGYKKRAEDLITDVFDSILENPSFKMGNIVDFLKVVPVGLKTRRMSDEDILKFIPQSDWGYFRSDSWIKRNTRVRDEPHSVG